MTLILGVFEGTQSKHAALIYVAIAAVPTAFIILAGPVSPFFSWPIWLANLLPFIGLAVFFALLWRGLSIPATRCIAYTSLYVLTLVGL